MTPKPAESSALTPTERRVVFLVGAVQFVNVVDFMMVMPLGAFFTKGLGIPAAKMGVVAGSYTLAAAVAGIIGSFFLDRFERRRALSVAMLGLVIGTALGGLAQGLGTMALARIVAGAFGGPATSLALSMVVDTVPPARRGRAMGAVMGAFSIASVLGVPGSVFLAELWGWRAPFLTVAAVGIALVFAALTFMAPMREHLSESARKARAAHSPFAMFKRPVVWLSFAAIGTTMAGAFSLIPIFSPYFTNNRGYVEAQIKWLYITGGVASFAAMRVAGIVSDRRGTVGPALVGTVIATIVLLDTFVLGSTRISAWVFFPAFMTAMAIRNVSFSTVSTKVPAPYERAAFMSWQSVVQHLASSFGAFVGSAVLTTGVGGRLGGLDRLAWLAIVLMGLLPFLLVALERRVGAPAVNPAPAPAPKPAQ